LIPIGFELEVCRTYENLICFFDSIDALGAKGSIALVGLSSD